MKKLNKLYTLPFKHTELTIEEKKYIRNQYFLMGKNDVYENVKKYKIIPFFAKTMIDLSIDKNFWEEKYQFYKNRNIIILDELNKIFTFFKENNIQKVFVSENFSTVLSSNTDIALFSSGDIDIFADKSEKSKIYECLKNEGYTLEERYAGGILVNSMFRSIKLDEFYYSVAWEPLSRTKLPSFLNINDFFDWSNLIIYNDTNIKIPDNESLFYIACMHMTLHSYSRAPHIRLLADISNMFNTKLNMEKVIMISEKNRTRVRLSTVLHVSNRIIDTPLYENNYLKDRYIKITKILTKHGLYKINPNRFQVLYLEIMSSDLSLLQSIRVILFPSRNWLHDKYRNRSYLTMLIKHWSSII